MTRPQIMTQIKHLLAKVMPEGASVFLFGSQARGDYSDKSDWDILILLNKDNSISISERGEYTFPIYELAARLGVEINPIIYTNRDWEHRKFTPFYKNVQKEGIKILG